MLREPQNIKTMQYAELGSLFIIFFVHRFEVEDRKEIIYRVEVQNRVYRREILVLDNEIKKLEREIANERSDSNRSSGVSNNMTTLPEMR